MNQETIGANANDNFVITGRIIKKRKKRLNYFMLLNNDTGCVQLVFKEDSFKYFELYKNGDIIKCRCIRDNSMLGRYTPNYDSSYIVCSVELVVKKETDFSIIVNKEKAVRYFKIKQDLRNYLINKSYIEVNVPILTDGEVSSMAKSYETYSCSGKKLFLRKTMDIFLRMYSCMDFHKVFSIGPCFRNCYPTRKSISEFEMLSIFSNYQTQEEAYKMAEEMLRIVLGKDILIKYTNYSDYIKLYDNTGIWIVHSYYDNVDSYVKTNEYGNTEEFKIKINGVTVAHGVMEIPDFKSYKNKIIQQGVKKHYGELIQLENALKSAPPPCFNIGFSIIRTLTTFNNDSIKDYDCFAISRLNQQMKKRLNI